jgi:signal peptidase I
MKHMVFYLYSAALLFLLLFFYSQFEVISVSGSSMEPTIQAGERVLAFRLPYIMSIGARMFFFTGTPRQGDIVLFTDPIERKPAVKRIAGVGGDRVSVVNEYILIENQKIPAESGSRILYQSLENIPPDHFFLLGDNTSNSLDSRNYGLVRRQRIVAKVLFWF